MATGESELATVQALNVSALMLADTMRSHAADLRIARDEAKLRYDTSLEASNAMFCSSILEALRAYDNSIARLTQNDDSDDDDDDD